MWWGPSNVDVYYCNVTACIVSNINCMLRGINEKKAENITVAYMDRCILDLGTSL